MDTPYICPECSAAHGEPADPRLGHRVTCLDCAIGAQPAVEIVVEIAACAA
jgi:hypothetical protein